MGGRRNGPVQNRKTLCDEEGDVLKSFAHHLYVEVIATAHEVDAVHLVVAADFLGDFLKSKIPFGSDFQFDNRFDKLGIDLVVVQKRLISANDAFFLVFRDGGFNLLL